MKAGKKIISFCLISILGILACVFLIPERLSSEFGTKYYWTYKAHTTDLYDFVFYGDSRIYRGISPDIVLEGTDYTGYNFGFSSGSLSSDMMIFVESRLDKTTNPTLVFGVTPHSLTQDAIKDEHYRQELFRTDYDVFQRYYLDGYLTPFDRITLEEIIGDKDWITYQHPNKDGWMKCDNKHINPYGALDHYANILTNNPIDSATMNGFFNKVRDWSEEGINVFAYRPPTTPEMEHLEDSITGFDEIEFIERFESLGGTWLRIDKTGYETYDGSHLREVEAARLSREINHLMGIH